MEAAGLEFQQETGGVISNNKKALPEHAACSKPGQGCWLLAWGQRHDAAAHCAQECQALTGPLQLHSRSWSHICSTAHRSRSAGCCAALSSPLRLILI